MDGLTALATIELLKPDAILMDLHISGQDGYDIVRHLREDATTQKIKIVALTTNSDEQEQSLQFGVDKCLNKPILPNQLLNQIESLNLGKNYED
jgi:two-component system sensor histidine kinase/response regulator